MHRDGEAYMLLCSAYRVYGNLNPAWLLILVGLRAVWLQQQQGCRSGVLETMTSSDAGRLHQCLSFVDVDAPASSRSRRCHRRPQVVFLPAITALQVHTHLMHTQKNPTQNLYHWFFGRCNTGGAYNGGGTSLFTWFVAVGNELASAAAAYAIRAEGSGPI